MAKPLKRTGHPSLYEAASEYLERGWRLDDSVFTPGRPVWTAVAFQELQREFVDHPDESKDSFEVKLERQLANCCDDAKQLMAELLAFHLLITRTITAPKKRELVDTVLGWMERPAEIPSSVTTAFEHGFINPGTYYNTGRPFQLRYLIQLGGMWKALPSEVRSEALADPVRFRDQLGDLHGKGAGSQRHVLLHLLFPSFFEAIVSDDHISKITKWYGHLIPADTNDPDLQLQEIRAGLTPKYGEGFHFYSPRLRPIWEQGVDPWPELVGWVARLHSSPAFDADERDYKLEAVAGFPEAMAAVRNDGDWIGPLTTCVKNSKNNLTDWRVKDSFSKWVSANPEDARSALMALWDGEGDPGQRVREFASRVGSAVDTPGNRTALASYLLMGADPYGAPVYKPGPFTKVLALVGRKASAADEGERYAEAVDFCEVLIAECAERGVHLRDRLDAQAVIWAVTQSDDQSNLLDDWSDEDKRAFFAWRDGAPGAPEGPVEDKAEPARPDGGETPLDSVDWMGWASRETHLPVDYLNELRYLLEDKGQLVLYGPPGTGKTYVAQVLARALTERDESRVGLVQFHPSTTYEDFFEGIRPRTDEKGQIHYEVRPGPLARFAAMAGEEPERQFVLIIDELNRANLPKVLGELLYLLEYRNEHALTLYRSDVPFALPKNLWIVATMNTVDRSVAIVDAAMRRRFHFVPFYPDRAPVSEVLGSICGDDDAWVAELVGSVNAELVDDLGGRDHQLGASHFINATRTIEGLERVWRYSVEPLIEDQFYGQEDRVAKYRWKQVLHRHAGIIPGGPLEPLEPAEEDTSELGNLP